MDDSLPSYGQATNRDPWSIIASFVRSADLCSAALVCRRWNAIFSPLLWGNPASHFGTENDAVYVALVRFKRTLYWANAMTRSLTHTMHFPPAQTDLYEGPRAEWVADILRRLPYLQSLVVAHIPFFDYAALSSLVRLSQPDPSRQTQMVTYQLRLLDASNCYNLTPHTLAAALRLFPGLAYLDLSGTGSARYQEVLQSFTSLPSLQILKMQRVWMGDDEVTALVRVVGRRLCSLDVRGNRITDRGIARLIQDAIRVHVPEVNGGQNTLRLSSKIQQVLSSEKKEAHIRRRLTTGFVTDLGIEAQNGQGITHLYISGNEITAAGASGLLRCKQLEVLDIGDIVTESVQAHHPKYELPPEVVSLPTAETLTSIIESEGKKLTYLRINHAVVTKLFCIKEAKAFEVEDTSLLVPPKNVTELETRGPAPRELHGQHLNEVLGTVPIYAELEGSPVADTGHNTSKITPPTHGTDDLEPVTVISPVLDATGGLSSPVSPITPHSDLGSQGQASINGILTMAGPSSSLPEVATVDGLELDEQPTQRHHQRHRTYSGVLGDHEARTRFRQSEDHNLLASTLGEIRTLVLTGVPAKSQDRDVSRNIIKFIEGCAEEERWAALQASVEYQLPPGPDRRSAELQYAQTLFPFDKLVLEMVPESSQVSGNSAKLQTRRREGSITSNMLSSTLDPDCETYLNAAKDDFSFFGSEECGQPDSYGTPPLPFVAFREKMTIDHTVPQYGSWETTSKMAVQRPLHDVLAMVSQFRKSKKAEFETARAAGREHVDGHWSGIIEVIRPSF